MLTTGPWNFWSMMTYSDIHPDDPYNPGGQQVRITWTPSKLRKIISQNLETLAKKPVNLKNCFGGGVSQSLGLGFRVPTSGLYEL